MHSDRRCVGLEQTAAEPFVKLETPATLAHAILFPRRVDAEFTLATQVGATVILVLVIYHMANQATGGAETWAVVIAYVGALRIALVGFSQAISAFAKSEPLLSGNYTILRIHKGRSAHR